MRVLIAPHSNIEGKCGVSEHVKRLAYVMKKQGFDVELSKLPFNSQHLSKNIFNRIFFNLSIIFKLRQRLKKEPDLKINWHFPSFLYTSSIEGVLNTLLLTLFNKKKVVLTIHGYIFEKNTSSLSLYLLSLNLGLNIVLLYPDFFKITKKVHQWFLKKNKVSYVAPFPSLYYSEKHKQSKKIGLRSIKILYFGVLSNQKRIDLLFNCVNTVKHKLIIASKNKSKIDCFKEGDFDRFINNSLKFNIDYKTDVDNNTLLKLLDNVDVLILPISSKISEMNSSLLLAKSTSKLIVTFTSSSTFYDSLQHIAYINYSDFSSCNRLIEEHAHKRIERSFMDQAHSSGEEYWRLFKQLGQLS